MKQIPLKPVLVTMILLTAWGQTNPVSAHDITGSLGKTNTAIDYIQVHCYNDSNGSNDHLEVKIKDLAPVAAPKVSIQLTRDNTTTNATDAIDGDAGYSPAVSVKGGDGYFYITIDKTATGAENYSVQFHCKTSDDQHTGTTISPISDQ